MSAYRKKLILGGAVGALAFGLASPSVTLAGPVTWEQIQNANDPHEVLTYGFGIQAQRFSQLKQINAKNVDKLEPVWSFSFGDEKQRGQEGQALVHDGVIYITASYSRIFALERLPS